MKFQPTSFQRAILRSMSSGICENSSQIAQALCWYLYLLRACAHVTPPAMRAARWVKAIVMIGRSLMRRISARIKSRKNVFPTPAGPLICAPPVSTMREARLGRCASRSSSGSAIASGIMSRSSIAIHNSSRSVSCTTVHSIDSTPSSQSFLSGRYFQKGTLDAGTLSRTKRDSPVDSFSSSSVSLGTKSQAEGAKYQQSTTRPRIVISFMCSRRRRFMARRFITSP